MLNEKQINCIKLMMQGDLTIKEIAERTKISEATVYNWKNNDEFMEEYDRQLKLAVRSLAPKAYKALGELLKSENEYIRLQAVKDALDRAGLKPGENIKIQGNGSVVILDDCEQ